MQRVITNQKGFALVYGIVVLLLASVGGTALLFLAQRDRIGAAHYSQMRSASQAAMTALRAFEGKMRNDPVGSLTLLKEYLDNQNKKYFFGNGPSTSEQKVKIWGNDEVNGVKSPAFSAKILGFDKHSYYITIEGKGYGSNGAIKKVIASYRLWGLALTDFDVGGDVSLYLGGPLENCNAKIFIKGDVYLSMKGSLSSQHFNQGGTIEGNLKTRATSSVLDFGSGGDLYVKKNAFMQCQLMPQGLFKVTGDAGFTYPTFYNFTKPIKVDGNAYFTHSANFGFPNCIDGDAGGGTTVYYDINNVSADRFKDFDNYDLIPQKTAEYVATQLGMTADEEEAFDLNIPTWESGVVKEISNVSITGNMVEGWWEDKQSTGGLFKDEWLVLKQTGVVYMQGGSFTKKVIWVTNGNDVVVNRKWYDCDLASNTLLIVNGSSALGQMGITGGGDFRGLIYLSEDNAKASTQYQFGSSSTVYGIIQHAGEAKFNLNGTWGDSLKIFYNDPIGYTAIQEIINTGIILSPGLAGLPERELVLGDTKIRPGLESLQL